MHGSMWRREEPGQSATPCGQAPPADPTTPTAASDDLGKPARGLRGDARSLVEIVHLASLGRADRGARVAADAAVSVAERDPVADFRIACASGRLAATAEQSCEIAQNQQSDRALPHCRAEAGACGAAGSAARCRPNRGVTGTEHGRSLIDSSASVTHHGRFRGRGTAASLWADACQVLLSPAAVVWLLAGEVHRAARSSLSGRGGQRSAVAQLRRPGPRNPP